MNRIIYSLSCLILLLSLVQCTDNAKPTADKAAAPSPTLNELAEDFQSPLYEYRPETWFHILGNNMTKEGITKDFEAIKAAGIRGVHLFNKGGRPFPGIKQIKVLSPEWEDIIRHAADESKRLGLKFIMQNCPGWSMTGGPWVPAEESQRELVEAVFRMDGGRTYENVLQLDEKYHEDKYAYQDVQVLAFPTPEGDDTEVLLPSKIESNNKEVPWSDIFNPEVKLKINERRAELSPFLKNYKNIGIDKLDGENTWVKVKL